MALFMEMLSGVGERCDVLWVRGSRLPGQPVICAPNIDRLVLSRVICRFFAYFQNEQERVSLLFLLFDPSSPPSYPVVLR